MGCTSLLRRYGTGSSRSNVPLHFDEYALATAIVSLDTSAGFEGGLVIQSTGSKRFLAELEQGDMLFHSYDLLHGVDVTATCMHNSNLQGPCSWREIALL